MRHFSARLDLALVSLLLLATTGCGVGESRILFVTLTGIMVNADSQPPALDIGYARQEGVYSPAFQNGEVPPVLATIRSHQEALGLVADQSYATGDAALMMAKEFSSVDNPCSESSPSSLCPPADSDQRFIHSTPAPNNLWDDFLSFFAVGGSDRHPYFFGTDTSIGLHVAWGTTTVPRAVSIGYKRKELSIVPLIETPARDEVTSAETPVKDNGTPKETPAKDKGRPKCSRVAQGDKSEKEVCVKLPSLIATSATNAKVKISTDTSAPVNQQPFQNDTGLQVNQTFATGDAATYLASDPQIRAVLGPQLVGANVEKFQTNLGSQSSLLESIRGTWNSGSPHTADEVVAKAGEIFGTKFDRNRFMPELKLFAADGTPESTKKLQQLQQYISGK